MPRICLAPGTRLSRDQPYINYRFWLALEQVVVAEGAPRHGGQELAKLLAKEGLHTTLIPDSAIFAMMARVNKVRLAPSFSI